MKYMYLQLKCVLIWKSPKVFNIYITSFLADAIGSKSWLQISLEEEIYAEVNQLIFEDEDEVCDNSFSTALWSFSVQHSDGNRGEPK